MSEQNTTTPIVEITEHFGALHNPGPQPQLAREYLSNSHAVKVRMNRDDYKHLPLRQDDDGYSVLYRGQKLRLASFHRVRDRFTFYLTPAWYEKERAGGRVGPVEWGSNR